MKRKTSLVSNARQLKTTQPLSSYSVQADVLRVLAALGVVLIHTVYSVYSRPDLVGGTAWWVALFINCISRIAIPVFIMLSGYLMLGKDETPSQVLDRTWKRLVLPLLIWFGLYVWWDARFFHSFQSPIDIVSMTLQSSIYHLYFLVILAGLYVLLPLWRFIINSHPSYTIFLMKLSLVIGMVYYFVQYTLFSSSSIFNSATIWIPYLGYFLLGHIFSQTKWFSNTKLLVLFGAGLALTLLGNYANALFQIDADTIFWRNGVSYFDEPLSPNVFLMSISFFQLMIHNQWLEKMVNKSRLVLSAIKECSSASFAVYLVHFMVIDVIDYRKGFAMEYFTGNLVMYFIIRTVLIAIFSFITASVMIRIPLFKKAFGLK